MWPANLDIDPRLLQRALQVCGARTKTAAVTEALRECIVRREQRPLLEHDGDEAILMTGIVLHGTAR